MWSSDYIMAETLSQEEIDDLLSMLDKGCISVERLEKKHKCFECKKVYVNNLKELQEENQALKKLLSIYMKE